jgi:hypothetical protein
MNVRYPSPSRGGRACSAPSAADADRQPHPTSPHARRACSADLAIGLWVCGWRQRHAVALETLARQSGDNGALLEWLAQELHNVAILVEWLGQAHRVVADEPLSIEWAALPAPVRVSLERLLASPGKRRILGTPGRLRLLKRL